MSVSISRSKLPLVARLLLILFAVGMMLASNATKLATPPLARELFGAWSGPSDGTEFLRMVLESNGKGYLTVSYSPTPHKAPELYQIVRWTLEGWKLEVDVKSIDAGAEPIVLTNIKIGEKEIRIEMKDAAGSPTIGWSRRITLYEEAAFEANVKNAKKRIDLYKQSNKVSRPFGSNP